MWTQQPGVNAEQHGYNADIRESASVAHLYGQNLRGRRIADGGIGRLGLVARDAQADRGQGAGDGPEPLRHPHVCAPAARRQGPGLEPGPLRSVVHAQRDLGGAGTGHGSPTSRAAPSCCSRAGSSRTSRTSTARTRTSRRCSATRLPPVPAGYNFDYVNADALVHLLSVVGRAARDAERHAVSRARARSRTAVTCRCPCCARFASWSRPARRSQARNPYPHRV